jgi:hypothetical protein
MQTQDMTTSLRATVLERFLSSNAGRQAIAAVEAEQQQTRVAARRAYDEARNELVSVGQESDRLLRKRRDAVADLESKLAEARGTLMQTEGERTGLHLAIERRRDQAETMLRNSAPAEVTELLQTVNSSLQTSRAPVLTFQGRDTWGKNVVTSDKESTEADLLSLCGVREDLTALQLDVDPLALQRRLREIRAVADPLLARLG